MAARFDYARYVALFNTGDDARLCDEFYCEDAVMLTAQREILGRQGLKDFLAWAHNGVRETLHPVAYARTGDVVLAEVDIAFSASRDWPEFPIAPIRAGETIVAKFCAVYELEGERIKVLKTMRWPAGWHVERGAP